MVKVPTVQVIVGSTRARRICPQIKANAGVIEPAVDCAEHLGALRQAFAELAAELGSDRGDSGG